MPETWTETLADLHATLETRRGADPTRSYTAKLLAAGPEQAAKKLGEEAVELAIAAVAGDPPDRARVISESADLLYHLLVLWIAAGVSPEEVADALAKRSRRSGLDEKASRGSEGGRDDGL